MLRDAARAARNFDLVSKLRDFDALRRAIGVKIGAPLSCDALHRLADHLGIVIVIVHHTGQALFGCNRTRVVLIQVEGDSNVLHAVGAELVEGTVASSGAGLCGNQPVRRVHPRTLH